MLRPARPGLWTRFKRADRAMDAAVRHGLFVAGRRLAAAWSDYATALERLRVVGPRRWVVDLACEGLTWGLAGGVVLLALAVPAVRLTADEDWLKRQDLAVTFLDRNGAEVGKRGIRHDDSVALEDLPPQLVKAVLATEDRRFFEHFGIDLTGTLRALVVNARASTVVQGGSSITQQLAKNLFLSNERSLERKVKEAFLALWLESRLTKREILKLYLDRAYMGAGAFGVAAASEFYFGKSPKDVTLAEAAMLAGLFKAPTKYAPHVNLPAARARAGDVLSNLVDAGLMTEAEVHGARLAPAAAVDSRRDVTADYLLDWAFGELRRMADEGRFGAERVLTARLALDPAVQARAEAVMEATLRDAGKAMGARQGAMVVMDPDGGVRAMVGGRDYGASQFNRATDALRQPGSSFKPYVYAAALLSGKYSIRSTVVDRPTCVGNWCPNNYNHSFAGAMPITVAMAKSINTIPVQMAIALSEGQSNKVGRARIVDVARAMGLTTPLADTTSLPIGAAEVTVLDQAAGYAVFANGGRKAPPHAALEVRNGRGEALYRYDRDAKPAPLVLPPNVVAEMNQMLVAVTESGTARRALLDGVRVGGKTGTTNAYHDAWFIGFTGNLVGAVWLGNDDYSPTKGMTGGTLPAQVWHDVMGPAHVGIDLKPIPGLPPKEAAPAVARAVPAAPGAGIAAAAGGRPSALAPRAAEALAGIEGALRERADDERREAAARAGAARTAGGAAPPAATAQLDPAPAPHGARSVGGRIAYP